MVLDSRAIVDREHCAWYLDLLHRTRLIIKINTIDVCLIAHENRLASSFCISRISELELYTDDLIREKLLVYSDIMYLVFLWDNAICAEFLVRWDCTVLLADDGVVFTIPDMETSQFSILSTPWNLGGVDGWFCEVRDNINISQCYDSSRSWSDYVLSCEARVALFSKQGVCVDGDSGLWMCS